jgi:hypothetical protein
MAWIGKYRFQPHNNFGNDFSSRIFSQDGEEDKLA